MNIGRWIAIISGAILIFGGFFISLEPATRIVALLAGAGSFLVGAFDPDNLMNVKFGKKGVEINRYQPTEQERELALKLAQEKRSPEIGKEGEKLIEEAKERTPEQRSPEDYLTLATEKWRAKDYDGALADVFAGLALNPKNVRVKVTLIYRKGVIYFNLGLIDEAVKLYNEAIILDPKFSWPHIGWGMVYRDQGKLEEAKKEYEIAIELDPKFGNPHVGLGFLYSKQGKLEEAKREYEIAIELYNQEKLKETKKEYKEAWCSDSDFILAKQNLERLKRIMEEGN